MAAGGGWPAAGGAPGGRLLDLVCNHARSSEGGRGELTAGELAYATSKGALVGITPSLAGVLADRGSP